MYKKITISLLAIFLQCIFALQAQQQPDYPTQIIDGAEYYLYPVEKSEGIYRICKKFDITSDELQAANPTISNGLQVGQTLKIPVKRAEKSSVATVDSAAQCIHVIAPKETLYGISHKYGVSIDELVRVNPEATKKMAIGTQLVIPKKISATATKPILKNNTDSTITPPALMPQLPIITAPELVVAKNELPIRIAYLLPFMTDATKHDASIDKFIEFYEGALLAINDAKNEGIRLEINTYDIEKNDIKIQTILDKPEFQTIDLIIGPAYAVQVKHVSDFAYANKTAVLIPFTSDVADVSINPYLYQFNATTEQENDVIFGKLSADTAQHSILFVNVSGHESTKQVLELQAELDEAKINYKQITVDAMQPDTLVYALDKTLKNTIIFNTTKYSIVKYIIAFLNNKANNYPIEMIGNYSWLPHFKDAAIPMYYTTLFSENQESIAYAEYTKKYNAFFGHELSTKTPRYDMLGYDLTSYFINAINTFGTAGLSKQISTYEKDGLLCSPLFMQKNELCGFINQRIYLLHTQNALSTTTDK